MLGIGGREAVCEGERERGRKQKKWMMGRRKEEEERRKKMLTMRKEKGDKGIVGLCREMVEKGSAPEDWMKG